MENYKDGEIIITGCNNCPFLHWHGRIHEYNPYCSLNSDIRVERIVNIIHGEEIIDYIPSECEFRKHHNFKLTRYL